MANLTKLIHGNKQFTKSDALNLVRMELGRRRVQLASLNERRPFMNTRAHKAETMILTREIRAWKKFELYLQNTELIEG